MNQDLRTFVAKTHQSYSRVFGVKFWTQIFVCVKKLTLSNSASMQVLYNCSWFTIWRFILDLRTFVAKSALSRLRALGGSFWPKFGRGRHQTSISCATARLAVIDSEGPSSIIKGPNIRSFVAKSVLSRFTRFLVVTAQTKHCQIGQLHD